MGGLTYMTLAIITYLVLVLDKGLTIDLLYSHVYGKSSENDKENWWVPVLCALLWPITLFQIILIKLKSNKLMTKRTVWGFVLLILLLIVGQFLVNGKDAYNSAIRLTMKYQKNDKDRLIVIDPMQKVVHQKLQLAGLNDSSYFRSLMAVTTMRVSQGGPQFLLESNPNANFQVVTAMYQDVSASISDYRAELMRVEHEMATTDMDYKTLRHQFPNNLLLFYMPAELGYEPISTRYNKEVNNSDIDERIALP